MLRSLVIAFLVAAVAASVALLMEVKVERYHLGPPCEEEAYPSNIKDKVEAPLLSGFPMKMFYFVLKTPLLGDIIAWNTKTKNGYAKVRSFAASVPQPNPMFVPYTAPSKEEMSGKQTPIQDLEKLLVNSTKSVVLKLHKEFVALKLTPTTVTENFFKALEKSNDRLRAVVYADIVHSRHEAEASSRRYRDGKPLSAMDGIPVAVKATYEVAGMPHTLGLANLMSHNGTMDDPLVVKLRNAGAIVVAITNMFEYGLGATGENWVYGTARNPHNTQRNTGGSSGGSAAVVAAGFVPVALGGDCGGSIRIPSAFCGVTGLMPTWGRLKSGSTVAWSVCNSGPIGLSVDDTMIIFHHLVQADGNVPKKDVPRLDFSDVINDDLSGLRVGFVTSWNAACDSEVKRGVESAVAKLAAHRAKIVPVEIPFADVVFAGHTVTLLTEMLTTLDRYSPHVNLSYPSAITLEMAKRFSSSDYFAAQIVRRWIHDYVKHLFSKVDIIVAPAVGTTAPLISSAAESGDGELNLAQTGELLRFMKLSNYIGIPSIVVPFGKDANHMPIGVQLLGNHWQETTLFRAARILEDRIRARVYHGESVFGDQP